MPGKSGKKPGRRKRRKAGQGQGTAADPSTEDFVEAVESPATDDPASTDALSAAADAVDSASPAAPAESADETDSVSSSATKNKAPAVSLREAREARGISVDDVVRELNLSREVVLGLEAGDYEFLGAPVFVKGHLRRYARYLDVPEAALLDGLRAQEPEPEEFRTLSRPRELKPAASLSSFILWGLLFLLLLFGIGYLLLGDDDESAAPAAVELPAPVTESLPERQQGPGRYSGDAGVSPGGVRYGFRNRIGFWSLCPGAKALIRSLLLRFLRHPLRTVRPSCRPTPAGIRPTPFPPQRCRKRPLRSMPWSILSCASARTAGSR